MKQVADTMQVSASPAADERSSEIANCKKGRI
jgi:hypothetical protein